MWEPVVSALEWNVDGRKTLLEVRGGRHVLSTAHGPLSWNRSARELHLVRVKQIGKSTVNLLENVQGATKSSAKTLPTCVLLREDPAHATRIFAKKRKHEQSNAEKRDCESYLFSYGPTS